MTACLWRTRVAEAIGIDSVEAECLPEEKHQELKHLMERGHRTMVIGDGINDGPILATADVGVAMGLSGSDIATNSAGVALMNDDLRHIPFLLSLARRTRSVISQNIGVSLLLAVIGLALAATGTLLTLWIAPFYYAFGLRGRHRKQPSARAIRRRVQRSRTDPRDEGKSSAPAPRGGRSTASPNFHYEYVAVREGPNGCWAKHMIP